MSQELRWSIRPNAYYDSVKLMRVSEALSAQPGVLRAATMMATPLNVELLAADGLLPPEVRPNPDHLLITVLSEGIEAGDAALATLEGLLAPRVTSEEGGLPAPAARTLEGIAPDRNLAVIAVPGPQAAAEAFAALRAGLHVFLFSDNVSVADEVRLKRMAASRDLLMMGPDCGTAILNGTGLGFANRCRPGPVGIVGASGTGIQHLCCSLDGAGIGIAQAIGTGGRDLAPPVGGSTTRRALKLLNSDRRVEVVVVISKPAAPGAAHRLDNQLQRLHKPVVVCLLGSRLEDSERVRYVDTLEDAARLTVDLLGEGADRARDAGPFPSPLTPRPGTRVYGLFTGGTLCSEAAAVLDRVGAPHELLDLGDDRYTSGRAHPMIDARLRASMLDDLSDRDDVGVVLLDVVLGDLAHPDPAGALVPALTPLYERGIPVVAVLLGTRLDPQGLDRQRATLEDAGALVLSSNAAAARLAATGVEISL